MALDL